MDAGDDSLLPAPLPAELEARTGASAFYIYWFEGGRGSTSASPSRERLLLAFPTPDSALAFAQRSVRRQADERPRLRRLTISQLIQAVLREPSIVALLLVAEDGTSTPAGALPPGLKIERSEIVRRSQAVDPPR